MKRIGVFVCHCGTNIAATVDVKKVVAEIKSYHGVAYAVDYKYMCSDPGQEIIKDAIKKQKLDAIIISACSPTLHENTFRNLCHSAGINPYRCEIANIREQCSWVHEDINKATQKAIEIIKMTIEKSLLNESLEDIIVPVTKRALVVGGGIAGMQAAIDIANAGHEVVLLERKSSIGGRMAQLSETFPTLDCSQCILTPKMVETGHHKNIKLITYSELEELSGYVGNFKAKIRKKATYVDWKKCNGCGICSEKCPTKVPSEFDESLGVRKAVYTPFPQAVPNKPVIDAEHCTMLLKGKCGICEKECPVGAIKYKDEDTFEEIEFGAVIAATGYDLYEKENLEEYGAGKIKNVLTGLQFERLLSASGPTSGEVRRPSDNEVPKTVAFLHCVGSRDPEKHCSYCSKICCMYTTKHAMLYKHKVHDGNAYCFYIDIRSAGKSYEEFVHRAQEEDKVNYIRGKVSRVYEKDGKVRVLGVDTLSGNKVQLDADLVVLATAIHPTEGIKELANKLKIATNEYGFLSEAHPKLRPLESLTSGIFIAGCAQGPKDIPETVAQASGAASKVIGLLSHGTLTHDPAIAYVDEELCSGCRMCILACAYNARKYDEEKKIAVVDSVLCEGCGACVSACPSGSSQQYNFTDTQIYNMIGALKSK
ncbi:4Fe-4S binding protein [Spirochaetota bacterium]